MEPHPVLAPYYTDKQGKQPFLSKVFDDAAPHYEGITTWGWLGCGQRYRRQALRRAGLAEGMSVLDVASGTGATARAAAEITGSPGRLKCLDPSLGMLAESRKRLDCEHILGGADHIDLPDGGFDFVTMAYALRHVGDLEQTFRECCRVLTAGGKLLILEMTVPANRLGRLAMKAYFKHLLPSLTRAFTRSAAAALLMSYYWETMEQVVPLTRVEALLAKAGFQDVKRTAPLGIFNELVGTKPG